MRHRGFAGGDQRLLALIPCALLPLCLTLTVWQGKPGVLESPTGTGKTLCLLCASLSWQQAQKAKVGTTLNACFASVKSKRVHTAD